MARFYLGVDGGQSSTTALIADEAGRVLGSGRAGPCNHVAGQEAHAKFRTVIGDCVAQASHGAGLHPDSLHFAAACLGLSGGAEDKIAFARELIRTDLLKVTNDAEIALTGATRGEPGIIVIAGTGSIAFGRDAAGRTARAGGWGYIFGDEGGAFDIARRALRAALQNEEGWGPPTILRARLLEETAAQNANALLHRFYAENRRHSVAALAPLVTKAAEDGDSAALAILTDAARILCWYVQGVYRNLFSDSRKITVAHIGGVFRSTPLRKAFAAELRATIRCETGYPQLSPASGALLEALRLDGNNSTLTNAPETKT